MKQRFSLSGLLRLRGIQQRQAAERLARATIVAKQAETRERHARAALAASSTYAGDVRTLAAIAASRVAARSQLAELSELTRLRDGERRDAEREHSLAKRHEKSIEKLEQAHVERESAHELKEEQSSLDEIATTRWKEPES